MRNLLILTVLVSGLMVNESPAQGLTGTIPYYRPRTIARPSMNRVNFRYGLPSYAESLRYGPSTFAVPPAQSTFYQSVVRYGPRPFNGLDASRDLYTPSPVYTTIPSTQYPSELYEIRPSMTAGQEYLRWRYGQDAYWYGRTSY